MMRYIIYNPKERMVEMLEKTFEQKLRAEGYKVESRVHEITGESYLTIDGDNIRYKDIPKTEFSSKITRYHWKRVI